VKTAKNITIKSARHLKNHRLVVEFSDGAWRAVDFKPFLERSNYPGYKKYRKISEFKKYQIIDGNINWDDYNMIFHVEDLYKGKI